jgi:glutamyl-tRNA reductase
MANSNDRTRPALIGAAQRVAEQIHGPLGACSGLLVTGSEMGEIIAEHLLAAGLGQLVVTARVPARADILARRLGCHCEPFEILHGLLGAADIVITAVGSGGLLIGGDMVADALALRRQKPIFLIDAAVPGDIHPAVNDLDGAFMYDIGDLESVAIESGMTAKDTIADLAADHLAPRLEAARWAVLAETPDADAASATRSLIDRFITMSDGGPRPVDDDEEQGG